MEKTGQSKVVVIGLDGAEWNLIQPWTEKGKLPTFKRLMQSGVWGELESTLPPVTFPAWKGYSTGKNPGKLGVYWWVDIDFERRKFIIHDSTSFKSQEFWDFMGRKNIKVGIINMPSTFPPKRLNGFMIAGFPASDGSKFTYPLELKEKLVRKFGYRINPRHHIHVYEKEALDEIRELVVKRFEVAVEYISEVDFMHLTIFYLDDVQHFFWRKKKLLLEFYQAIDTRISELMDLIGDEGYVFIMSDHGFTGLSDTFYVNEWLSREGYLVKKKTYVNVAHKFGFTQDRVVNLGKKTRLFPVLLSRLPRRALMKLKKMLPLSEGKTQEEGVESIIDWDRSLAVALKQGPVYLNKRKLAGDRYKDLVEELKNELLSLIHPKTQKKIIGKVFEKKEIYSGEFTDRAPDLLVIPEKGYEVDMALSLHSEEGDAQDREYETMNRNRRQVFNKWIATHRRHGIFLAHGPDVRRGSKVEDTQIYDLAPTLLHIFNIPIPRDIDGRVLTEIFRKGSKSAKRRVEYRSAAGTEEDIQET